MQKPLRLIAAPLALALACSTVGCTIYGEKKPPTLANTCRRIAIVAPNANYRGPTLAATRTDGVNHSLMNKHPSSDHSPARGHPL